MHTRMTAVNSNRILNHIIMVGARKTDCASRRVLFHQREPSVCVWRGIHLYINDCVEEVFHSNQ